MSTNPDQSGSLVDYPSPDCVYTVNLRSRLAPVLCVAFEDATLTLSNFYTDTIPNRRQSNKIQQGEAKKMWYVQLRNRSRYHMGTKLRPGQQLPSGMPCVDSALWCKRLPVCIQWEPPFLDPSLSEDRGGVGVRIKAKRYSRRSISLLALMC